MHQGERVGLLIVRAERTGRSGDPLRARVTWLARLDEPEAEQTVHVASRGELHAVVDRWLDAVALAPDPRLGWRPGGYRDPA